MWIASRLTNEMLESGSRIGTGQLERREYVLFGRNRHYESVLWFPRGWIDVLYYTNAGASANR
jgi:hypothetical protein